MTLWIVRFIPYGGGANIDGVFSTLKDAQDLFNRVERDEICFQDDFSMEVCVDPTKCAVILINTDASASMQKALNDANHDAAREQGLMFAGKIDPGSTVQ